MKLTKLVSVFLKEDKQHFSQKQGHNFILTYMYHVTRHMLFTSYMYTNLGLFTFHCVVRKHLTEHVIMLKEIFDRQELSVS